MNQKRYEQKREKSKNKEERLQPCFLNAINPSKTVAESKTATSNIFFMLPNIPEPDSSVDETSDEEIFSPVSEVSPDISAVLSVFSAS
jgi:hypothetical protein